MSTQDNEQKKCCCPGPTGPAGPMGPQGPQGVPGEQGVPGVNGTNGTNGVDGVNGQDGQAGAAGHDGPAGPRGPQGPAGQAGQAGQNGSQGPMGPVGPQGLQGPQGVSGDCVECPCVCPEPEFAEVYSQLPQTLSMSPGTNMAGGNVIFEKLIVATAGIDASQAGIDGSLKILKSGWYDIAAGMTGTLNPIAAPLPVWTLSLFQNSALVDGSTFSNVPLSPAQGSNEITADTFVFCNVGDIIQLANTSTAPLLLSAPTLGTNAQTNSAYLKVVLLSHNP